MDQRPSAAESPGLIHLLREAYGLAALSCTPIAHGAMNWGFRVLADDGQYHLKRYNPQLYRPDQIRHILTIQATIGQLGIPVPAIIRNRGGDQPPGNSDYLTVVLGLDENKHDQHSYIPARLSNTLPPRLSLRASPVDRRNYGRRLPMLARGRAPTESVSGTCYNRPTGADTIVPRARGGIVPIRLLTPDVARLIAAGEVVTRPADVVKELVENAIDAVVERRVREPDAEPPFIRIEIRAGGLGLIRVVDNGRGIAADEVALAFQRHATSKVTTADDLDAIQTLGFRGEALASIAAVAQVQVVTRTSDAAAGVSLTVASSEIGEARPHGAAVGTAIAVRNLFANVPARRKFLKTGTGESTFISNVISQYALAYPEIRLTLTNDERTVLQTSGRGNLQDTLVDVLGAKVAGQLIPVEYGEGDLGVSGYAGTPEVSRATRTGLTFFVNRRWIRSQMLSHAVEDAYPQAMLAGRHPIAIINLQVPADTVDVNVHPSKAEVRFANDRQVYHVAHQAVRAALGELAPLPGVSLAPPVDWAEPGDSARATTEGALALFAPMTPPSGIGPAAGTPPGDPGVMERDERASPSEQNATPSPEPTRPAPAEIRMSVLRPVGQVQGTYIVAEDADGVYFIDQHAAHEAVLYQQIRDSRRELAIGTQELLQPQSIELSLRQEQALTAQPDDLAGLGFRAEPFGERAALLRGVPASLRERDFIRTFLEILDLIAAQTEAPDATSEFDPISARLACHSAVRDGDSLSTEEMRALLEQIEQQPNLWNYCPHGRPIFLRVSSSQLARDFRRK